MKYTVAQLLIIHNLLEEWSKDKKKMNSVTAFKLGCIKTILKEKIKHFENERVALFKEYGEEEKDANGKVTGTWVIKKEDMPKYNQDIVPLLNTEITLFADTELLGMTDITFDISVEEAEILKLILRPKE